MEKTNQSKSKGSAGRKNGRSLLLKSPGHTGTTCRVLPTFGITCGTTLPVATCCHSWFESIKRELLWLRTRGTGSTAVDLGSRLSLTFTSPSHQAAWPELQGPGPNMKLVENASAAKSLQSFSKDKNSPSTAIPTPNLDTGSFDGFECTLI